MAAAAIGIVSVLKPQVANDGALAHFLHRLQLFTSPDMSSKSGRRGKRQSAASRLPMRFLLRYLPVFCLVVAALLSATLFFGADMLLSMIDPAEAHDLVKWAIGSASFGAVLAAVGGIVGLDGKVRRPTAREASMRGVLLIAGILIGFLSLSLKSKLRAAELHEGTRAYACGRFDHAKARFKDVLQRTPTVNITERDRLRDAITAAEENLQVEKLGYNADKPPSQAQLDAGDKAAQHLSTAQKVYPFREECK
jgi:hypothetical protein